MKRKVFFGCFALFMATSFVCQAQQQYYFNEGDTIYGRDTIYHYEWWSDQWLASDPMHKLFLKPSIFLAGSLTLHGRIVQYHYTDQPLNVVGIATSFFNYLRNGYNIPSDIPPERQEYVLLYEADTSRLQFYEVGRIPIDYSKPARYMNVNYREDGNYCCGLAPDKNSVIKIREYYFDKPVTVRDSFYVGHTTFSSPWPDPEFTGYSWNYNVACWSLNYVIWGGCESSCDILPYQRYKFKQEEFQNENGLIDSSLWYYFNFPEWEIEFPIIEVDSSFYDGPPQYVCPKVENFRLSQALDGGAVFLWDTHGDHQYWQISYGPAGTEPDDGTMILCPIQVGQILGLDTCTDYVAYIRAVCNHDSIVFSEWSEPLNFSICDTTGSGTEDIEGSLGQFVKLFPNPASDQVQVMSSFEIRGIEVYDLNGNTMLKQDADGHSLAFSAGDWPSGIYVAVIRTNTGNFAKKLVIK